MLSPRTSECKQCADILPLIKEIDCILFNMAKNMYNNITLMLNIPIYEYNMLTLLNYKRILTYKYFNSSYADKYSVNMIASKVKLLKYRKNGMF